MHNHGGGAHIHLPEGTETIVLVGNPNVGKSVIFALLTGHYVTVSNYPGTTVEIAQAVTRLDGQQSLVIDTPGINSLLPMSEDEEVTRDVLLRERPRTVVQVADAKNLPRALLITLELAEMGLPMVLVLNMADEAASRGISIDISRLAELLGVKVVSTVATQRKGLPQLLTALVEPQVPHLRASYPQEVEEAITHISSLLPQDGVQPRALALMLLAGDTSLEGWLEDGLEDAPLERLRDELGQAQDSNPQGLRQAISRERIHRVREKLARVYRKEEAPAPLVASLGRWAMHPLGGVPILLVVLWAIYKFVGEFGAGTLVDLLEGVVFGEYLNPLAQRAVEALIPFRLVQEFLVGPYGLITMALTYAVAIILPIVGTFFIAFGLLEDSGYLPRLAVMVNRIFKLIGLNGKAILPMILGLGCDTMATLTARILESRKERVLVTLLLALAVPCSAQLGVILGMLGAVSLQAMAIWVGVVVGVMLLVGRLAAWLVPGESSDFILEVPPLRRPQLSNILIKTWARVEWYLREAVPLFFLGTLLLFLMDKLGLLSLVEEAASPLVVSFLGLPREAAAAFIVGFLRRDYGAAGLFALQQAGMMSDLQVLVSLVTMTLFVPCIAHLFIIIKERGWQTALAMMTFIFPFALLVGGSLNLALSRWGIMP